MKCSYGCKTWIAMEAFGCYEVSRHHPAGIYCIKVNKENARSKCEICSKLTMKTPESGVSIVDMEQVNADRVTSKHWDYVTEILTHVNERLLRMLVWKFALWNFFEEPLFSGFSHLSSAKKEVSVTFSEVFWAYRYFQNKLF